MGRIEFLKKPKTEEPFTETTFECKRAYPNAKLHIIEGGAHGFGKKHDAIAIAHLRRFAGRDGK